MALSNKRLAFVNEYLRDFNATQAAIRAGYSPKSAYSIGQENLKIPEISAYISARVEEKAMSADEALTRLADIARGDMGDFLDIGSMGFIIDLNGAQEKGLTKLIKKVRMRTVTTLAKDGTETETHDTEIELYSALDALVQIGRHHALFTDKHEEIKKSYHVTIDGEEIDDE